jgi:hypothetical protein
MGCCIAIVKTSRTYYMGGPKESTFSYGYDEGAMDTEAAPIFTLIQDTHKLDTGMMYSIIELAEIVLDELRSIDADCRANGYYRVPASAGAVQPT